MNYHALCFSLCLSVGMFINVWGMELSNNLLNSTMPVTEESNWLVLDDPDAPKNGYANSRHSYAGMYPELQFLAHIIHNREKIYEDITNGAAFTDSDFKSYLASTFQSTSNFHLTRLAEISQDASCKIHRRSGGSSLFGFSPDQALFDGERLEGFKSAMNMLKGGGGYHPNLIPLLKKFLNPRIDQRIILTVLEVAYVSCDYQRNISDKFTRLEQLSLFDIIEEKNRQSTQPTKRELSTTQQEAAIVPPVNNFEQQLQAANERICNLKNKNKLLKEKYEALTTGSNRIENELSTLNDTISNRFDTLTELLNVNFDELSNHLELT